MICPDWDHCGKWDYVQPKVGAGGEVGRACAQRLFTPHAVRRRVLIVDLGKTREISSFRLHPVPSLPPPHRDRNKMVDILPKKNEEYGTKDYW